MNSVVACAFPDNVPNDDWDLKQLSEFCSERRKRSAMDIVLIGRALTLAKARCKTEGVRFTDWKKENGFSDATVSRYMRLARMAEEDAEFCDMLLKVGPLDAYIATKLEAPRKKIPRWNKSAASQSESPENDVALEPADKPPVVANWQVIDSDDPPQEPIPDVVPIQECLEKELQEVIPQHVRSIRETVSDVLRHDDQRVRAALPRSKTVREQIAADIDALCVMLSQLSATLREPRRKVS
jgi:hypothetical protein